MNLLQNLRIEEMSAVDAPAHELPGWMVAKAAKSPDALLHEFKKLAAEINTAALSDDEKVAAMRKALRLAPASVREALEAEAVVMKFLEERARENGHSIPEPAGKSTGSLFGRFVPGGHAPHPAQTVTEKRDGLLTWRHGGASLLR